jgi:dihydroorotate dehydrogenase (NAD+) catalytic subunit
MAEVTSGMLNAIGLQNSGLDAFMEKEAPWIAEAGVPIFVSVAGTSVEEYTRVTVVVRDIPGVVGIEANISCPNVERRNQVFACHPDQAAEVVGAMSRLTSLPIFAKLTADVTDIVEVAEACIRAGAHGLSLINTLLGLAIDVETFRPRLGAVTGGLSGPAIHPIAVRCVYQVARAFPKVPIMGIGGVASARDAIELMLAGAWAVQVGTANFYEPEATIKIAEGVADFLARKGLSGPRDLVGRGRIRHGGTQSAGGAG